MSEKNINDNYQLVSQELGVPKSFLDKTEDGITIVEDINRLVSEAYNID